MVQFGCCLNAEPLVDKLAEGLSLLHGNGYDFVELRVAPLAALSPADFGAVARIVERSPIKAPSFNIFLPGSLSLTGPNVQTAAVRDYLEQVLPRVQALGGRLIVFGSGGARRVPDGFPVDRARRQLDEFLTMCEELAGKRNILIAIEPLNRKETNIINTVAEGFEIADRLGLGHVRLLADCYHMYLEKESYDVFRKVAKQLAHVHIADGDRTYPGHSDKGGVDFAALFRALKDIGYDGLVSTEAKSEDFAGESRASRAFVRGIWERA
jgi:D-psicose/D-tagatose/L-ribulose 3-epimerase